MRTYNLNVSNCFWGEVAEEPELQPELQPEASEPIAVETVEVKGEGTLKVRIPDSLNYYKMCIQMVMSSHVFVVGMTVNLETGWGWRDQRPKRKRGHSFSNSIFNSASVWFLKTCIYIYTLNSLNLPSHTLIPFCSLPALHPRFKRPLWLCRKLPFLHQRSWKQWRLSTRVNPKFHQANDKVMHYVSTTHPLWKFFSICYCLYVMHDF